MEAERPHVLLVQETYRRTEDLEPPITFNGYSAYTSERSLDQKKGGGLISLIKNNLLSYRWNPEVPQKWEIIKNERIWLIMNSSKGKIAILNIYTAAEIAGQQEFKEWNDKLFEMIGEEIDTLKKEGCRIIVAGDLNGHCGSNFPGALRNNKTKVNYNGKKILELIITKGLTCENDEEVEGKIWTWNGKRTDRTINSVLDYCLTHGLTQLQREFRIKETEISGIRSDHNMIQLQITIPRLQRKEKKEKKAEYTLGKNPQYEAYKEHTTKNLKKIPLRYFREMQQRDQIEHLENSMLKAAKHCFPKKQKKNRISYSNRMPAHIIKRLEEQKKLWKLLRMGLGGEPVRIRYLKLRDITREEIKKVKRMRRRRLAIKLHLHDPTRAKFWELVKIKATQNLKIEALRREDGNVTYNDEEMKEIIYQSFSKRLDGKPTQQPDPDVRQFQDNMHENNLMQEVTFKEVKEIIASFKNGKAKGPRGMKFEMIKNLSQESMKYLVVWLNKVITEARIDPVLNVGSIKLLFKKEDPTIATNYRPICVSPILSKCATKLINTRLVKLVEAEEILSQSQIGFRPGKSTRSAVFTLGVVIGIIKQWKLPAILSFIDLAAAYDSTNRMALFEALNDQGLGGKFTQLIASIYTRDYVTFEVNGSETRPMYMTKGVRQVRTLVKIM